MKTCTKCKIEKELVEFNKNNQSKDGHHVYCRPCVSVMKKAKYQEDREEICRKRRKHNKENKEEVNKKRRLDYQKNKERILKSIKKYRNNNKEDISIKAKVKYQENRDKILLQKKQYAQDKREDINEYHKKYVKDKIKSDPVFKLKRNVRRAILSSLQNKGFTKTSKTAKILSCTFEELHEHLIKTFETNYNLPFTENTKELHIDHITPLATAKTEEEVLKLNHYTNLQYLYKEDNLAKSDSLNWKVK